MDDYKYLASLKLNRPYFGPRCASRQGNPARHRYMSALVSSWTSAHPGAPCQVLEIGSWTGGSAITWAKALDTAGVDGHVVCIDKWEVRFEAPTNVDAIYKEMTTVASSGEAERLFWHNVRAAGVERRIVLLRGLSQQILPLLEGRHFSIVFVDGSHMYQDVFHDIRNAMTLVQDDGIVCGDDLDVQRTECSESGLQHGIALHTDYQLDERTGTWYHPGVTAAVAELLGPVSVWEGFWAMRRADEAWKSVQLANIEDAVPAHLRSTEEVVPTLVVEGINGYNIIQADDAYVGIPAAMGPLRIEDEASLMTAMRVSIVGTSVDAVKEEIAVRSRHELGPNQTRASYAVTETPTLLLEGYKGFNLLSYGDRYYGLAQSIGPVRLDGPEFQAFVHLGLAAVAPSEADIRGRIDGLASQAGEASAHTSRAAGVAAQANTDLHDDLKAVGKEIESVLAAVTDLAAAIGTMTVSVATREKERARLALVERELTERTATLAEAIAARDDVARQLATAVADYERLMKELTAATMERDRVIAAHAGCGQTLASRTKELLAAQQHLSKLASAEATAKQRHEADIVELREARQRIRDMRRRIKASENARQILEAEGKELLSWIQRLQHEFVSSGRAS